MPRYIDADKAGSIENLDDYSAFAAGVGDVRDVQDVLADATTADVAPVVHAHWIDTGRSDGNDNYDFVCCRCKHTDIHSRQVKVPYCWFCGARMDEQEET